MQTRPFQNLSDLALIEKSELNVKNSLAELTQFLLMLIEIEFRRLYAKQGYSSVFKFLLGKYNFSETSAAKLLKAARFIKIYPKIQSYLETGKVHLCGFYLVAKYLTPENYIAVLDACVHKSRNEVEVLIAKLFPQSHAPKRDHVQPVGKPASVKSSNIGLSTQNAEKIAAMTLNPESRSHCAGEIFKLEDLNLTKSSQIESPNVEEVTQEVEMRISTNLSMEDYNNLMRAKTLLKADNISTVIARAVELLLAKVDPLKKKVDLEAIQEKQKVSAPTKSRYIPVKIKDAVHQKYHGQCSYIAKSGKQCLETRYLEIDHIRPLAFGGRTELSNLKLLCKCHNGFMAREMMGDDFINQKICQTKLATFPGK